jgi:hypothetical protein
VNVCPHCGAPDNTGVEYYCGTQYLGEPGSTTETMQSDECRRAAEAREQRIADATELRLIHRHFPDTDY